jgi:hypothetical protein
MNFIVEYKSFYKVDDIVYIEYWYNNMITPVKIKERSGSKFLISHSINESKIQNAPEELISPSKIISKIN